MILNKMVIAAGLLVLSLLFLISTGIASGVKTTPPMIFYNYNEKSAHISVLNPSDNPIEVWIDFKYGYTIVDDTGLAKIILPDTLDSDDRSAASWLKAFPQRFILGPQEVQIVRVVASAPAGTGAGEYWARILLSSKDQKTPFVKGKSNVHSAIEIYTVNSVPLHYRYQSAVTGIKLTKPAEYKIEGKNLVILLPFQRTGNASYWGQISCRVFNSSGKSVFTNTYKLVVYKDLGFEIKIDNANLPAGNYTVELIAKTERTDVQKSLILKSDPFSVSLPVTIQ